MKTIKRFILYGVPKSLLIKIILALVIILIGKNVFAQQIDISNKIIPSSSGSSGRYYGTEIYNTGTNNLYTINTRYNGQLSKIDFYIRDSDYSFDLNKTYTITLNMATSDWRNNFMGPLVYAANNDGSVSSGTSNWFVSNTFSFVSMKKIKFNIRPTGTIKPLTKFTIYSSNVNSTPITGVSNWNLSSIIIDDNTSSGSSGGSSTPVGPSTSFDDTAIINNQNQNTEDIINNQDKNTSDVIENSNHNTEVLNESLNSTCKDTTITIDSDLSMRDSYYVNNEGIEVYYPGAYISNYIKLKPNSVYKIKRTTGGSQPSNFGYCRYNVNKYIYKCDTMPSENSEITFTSDNYDAYLRVSFYGYRMVQVSGPICNDFTSDKIDSVGAAIEGSINGGANGIINNNNSNTNTIIDNQNQNTNKTNETIENQFQNCRDSYNLWGGFTFSKYSSGINFTYNNDGSISASGTSTGVALSMITGEATSYYKTLSPGTYTLSGGVNVNQRAQIFDSSGNEIASSGSTSSTFTLNESKQVWIRLRIAQGQSINTLYKIQLQPGNSSSIFEPYGDKVCTNRLDEQTNAINDVNDSINNPNVDSGTGSDFFDSFHTDDNGGISAIVTKPLTIVNNLLSNNNSCSNLPLPEFMGVNNAYLPSGCILWNNAPSTAISLWNIFVCGFGAYFILKDLFKIIENLKNPDNDRVEVMDL